jgi:hypothetical protein
MTEQAVLPTLDLPPVRYAADLPADRILTALIAAGDRFGCWILRHQSDPDWNDGCVFHFATEQDATDLREDLLSGLDPGQHTPELVIEQAFRPCFTLACASCGSDLGLEDPDIPVVHRQSLARLEEDAGYQCWSTDGRDWNCPACPTLTSDDAGGQVPS